MILRTVSILSVLSGILSILSWILSILGGILSCLGFGFCDLELGLSEDLEVEVVVWGDFEV